MTKFATFGLFAVAFAASALVASTVFAQDRSIAHKRPPSTFDGQIVSRSLVRGLMAGEGLDYTWHDYCRGAGCAVSHGALDALGDRAPDAALLFVEWRGNAGEPHAAVLVDQSCAVARNSGVRSLRYGRSPERSTGVRSIRSGGDTPDCFGGYRVLARLVMTPS